MTEGFVRPIFPQGVYFPINDEARIIGIAEINVAFKCSD